MFQLLLTFTWWGCLWLVLTGDANKPWHLPLFIQRGFDSYILSAYFINELVFYYQSKKLLNNVILFLKKKPTTGWLGVVRSLNITDSFVSREQLLVSVLFGFIWTTRHQWPSVLCIIFVIETKTKNSNEFPFVLCMTHF